MIIFIERGGIDESFAKLIGSFCLNEEGEFELHRLCSFEREKDDPKHSL
jgi:hypothetical protein